MSYLKIKCNEYYLIKLNDVSLVDKIYNYKISQYVECIYFRNVCARQRCCLRYFMNDTGEWCTKNIGSQMRTRQICLQNQVHAVEVSWVTKRCYGLVCIVAHCASKSSQQLNKIWYVACAFVGQVYKTCKFHYHLTPSTPKGETVENFSTQTNRAYINDDRGRV